MSKTKLPETEYGKLMHMLDMYEKILHPDFFYGLKKQLWAAHEENKKEAYAAAKISDDALEIEREFIRLKEKISKEPLGRTFYIKCLYKSFLKKFIK